MQCGMSSCSSDAIFCCRIVSWDNIYSREVYMCGEHAELHRYTIAIEILEVRPIYTEEDFWEEHNA